MEEEEEGGRREVEGMKKGMKKGRKKGEREEKERKVNMYASKTHVLDSTGITPTQGIPGAAEQPP